MKKEIIMLLIATTFIINMLTGCDRVYQSYVPDTINVVSNNTEVVDNNYYLSYLKLEDERQDYLRIYQSLSNREQTAIIKCKELDRIKELVWMVRLDHPEIFYIDNSYNIEYTSENTEITWSYSMSLDEMEEAQKNIDKYTVEVLRYIDEKKSAYDKEKAIFDYISLNTEFDTEAKYDQSMYSVVNKKAVCMGYSLMFKYICNQTGIQCIVVTGAGENELHAWNVVEIDGEWFMVDCSTGEKSFFNENGVSYSYFNITRKQMLRSVSIDNLVSIPECTSVKYEYYNMNDRYFDKVDLERYRELVYNTIESGENTIIIRCSDEETYNKMLELLNEVLLNIYEENVQFEICSSNKHLLIKAEYT